MANFNYTQGGFGYVAHPANPGMGHFNNAQGGSGGTPHSTRPIWVKSIIRRAVLIPPGHPHAENGANQLREGWFWNNNNPSEFDGQLPLPREVIVTLRIYRLYLDTLYLDSHY